MILMRDASGPSKYPKMKKKKKKKEKKTVWLTTFFKVFCRRKKFIRIWNMRVCK